MVRSEVNIDSTELKLRRALDPQADSKRSLQGQSPFLVNLDLSYDHFATGTAAGIYYNIFGRRLAEVSLGGTRTYSRKCAEPSTAPSPSSGTSTRSS